MTWLKRALTNPRTGEPSTTRLGILGGIIGFLIGQLWSFAITSYIAYYYPEHLDKLAWLPSMTWGSGGVMGALAGAYGANVKWGASTETGSEHSPPEGEVA